MNQSDNPSETEKKQTREQTLANAFAEYVVNWADTAGLGENQKKWLEKSAEALSMTVSSGNTCLPLEKWLDEKTWFDKETWKNVEKPADLDKLRKALLNSGIVACPDKLLKEDNSGNKPLVLYKDKLYLQRYFHYEKSLVKRLVVLINKESGKTFDDDLSRLKLNPEQAKAVKLAMEKQFLIITGGPGTGKTWTATHILNLLQSHGLGKRIMLAAPTGKAAMRMREAIRNARKETDISEQEALQAQTIHRLLGMSGDGRHARYHAKNLLPLDTLIVDEVSMLDSQLATRLFAAIPPDAKVILLGDRDQLSSVEAGSVLADLINALEPYGHVVELKESHRTRNAPVLTGLADCIREIMHGKTPNKPEDDPLRKIKSCIEKKEEVTWLEKFSQNDLTEWYDKKPDDSEQDSPSAFKPFESYFSYMKKQAETHREDGKYEIEEIFRMFNYSRILCAMREDKKRGIEAVNKLIAKEMYRKVLQGKEKNIPEWFTGKPVIIRKNNYSLKLFNGDIGIALPDVKGGFEVHFQTEDGKTRSVPALRLPSHDTAFAMTVHQSQGSEFDSVALLLPEKSSRALCCELVYTGITRAKKNVTLIADGNILKESLFEVPERPSGQEKNQNTLKAKVSERFSGLREMLGEVI